MKPACKNCEYMMYIPKEKPYGIGLHWCIKYNNATSEVKYCDNRNITEKI